MVILSDSLFEVNYKNKCEKRKTHLLLGDKNITHMETLKNYCNFKLIDLRNNKLNEVKNISNQLNLTHLYLQNNEIKNLEGFNELSSLEVLYLDFNKIVVIENLENCPLKKLSLKGQKIDPFQTLAFDPSCLMHLKDHLMDINVASNKLLTIRPLRYLHNLQILDISNNKLCDLNIVCEDLTHFPYLNELRINNNPVSKNPEIRVQIVSQLKALVKLNDQEINYDTRSCCENIYRNKNKHYPRILDDVIPIINAAKRSCEDLPITLRPKITQEIIEEIKRKKVSRNKLF